MTKLCSNPTEAEAKKQGCLCEWWGRGSIIRFDADCPVLHLHRGVPKLKDKPMSEPNPKAGRAIADGKTPLERLEPAANEQIAAALQIGAAKYGARNYAAPETSMLMSTYIGALLRHTTALQRGEQLDPETGLSHLAHIGANVHVCLASIEAGTMRFDTRDTTVTERSDQVHVAGDQQAKAEPRVIDMRGESIGPFSRIFYPRGTVYTNAHVDPFVVQAACCMGPGYALNADCTNGMKRACHCSAGRQPIFPNPDHAERWCTGDKFCAAVTHVHGCFADKNQGS